MNAEATAVFVQGTDVYVVINEHDPNGILPLTVKLWKNGNVTVVSNGNAHAQGTGVFVSGADVYVVFNEQHGNIAHVPKLWKNGIISDVTDGSREAYVYSIFVQP